MYTHPSSWHFLSLASCLCLSAPVQLILPSHSLLKKQMYVMLRSRAPGQPTPRWGPKCQHRCSSCSRPQPASCLGLTPIGCLWMKQSRGAPCLMGRHYRAAHKTDTPLFILIVSSESTQCTVFKKKIHIVEEQGCCND